MVRGNLSRVICRLTDPRKDSPYHAPPPGSRSDRLRRLKLTCAYLHYRRLIVGYQPHILSENARVGEIGCGPGYLLSMLEHWFPKAEILAMDRDASLLEEARARSRSSLLCANAESLPLEAGVLDVAIALHLVEHLHAPDAFIANICRALKPGGILVLATPNLDGIGSAVMRQRWGGCRDDHVALKAPKEWSVLLAEAGLSPCAEGTTGLSGIPIFRRFPLALLNWGALALFGMFPWSKGEAYIGVWRKQLPAK